MQNQNIKRHRKKRFSFFFIPLFNCRSLLACPPVGFVLDDFWEDGVPVKILWFTASDKVTI